MVVNIIRLLLSTALVYGVYTETGPWTTLFAALVVVQAEVLTYLLKKRDH